MDTKRSMRGLSSVIGAVLIGITGLIADGETPAQADGPYKVDPESVTVSGISSGADLAHQLHIAHSSLIRGVGLLAASPYYCAQGDADKAMEYCSRFAADATGGQYTGPPDENYIGTLITETETAFTNQAIDDPANVADDKIYLFSGGSDTKVPQEIMDTVQLYYTKLNVDPGNMTYVKTVPAGHAMVTDDFGNQCSSSSSPFINECQNGDVAGELLNHVYGPLADPADAATRQIIKFCQKPFFAEGERASMDDFGHLYVPEGCANGAQCKLHVAIHGCQQNDDQIQGQFYTQAGYNEWAEANAIMVLYPQVQKTTEVDLLNPFGCWDWWGYSGDDYHTQAGKQISAVKGMIDRLIAGGPLPPETAPECETDGCSCTGFWTWLCFFGITCN